MERLFFEEVPDNTLMIKKIDGVLYMGVYHETYFADEPNTMYRGFEPLFAFKEDITEDNIIKVLENI